MQAGKKPAVFLQSTIVPHDDEGFIQKAPVAVAYSVRPNQTLYISVWAVNKVSRLGSVGNTRGHAFKITIFNVDLDDDDDNATKTAAATAITAKTVITIIL